MASAVSAVYLFLLGLPTILVQIVVNLAYLVVYPVIVILNYASDDIGYVYNTGVLMINTLLSIGNLGISITNTTFAASMPSIWVTLLLTMIAVNGAVQGNVGTTLITGLGGLGGGGNGANNPTNSAANGANGTTNTGGGGGGASFSGTAGSGGSGIVIVRYLATSLPSYVLDGMTTTGSASATGLYACKRLRTSYTGPVMQLTDPATVLLLHCNNPSTNNTNVGGYIDASSYNNTMTSTTVSGAGVVYGTPGTQRFGTTCLSFDGKSTLTASNTCYFQANNFTIEFWMYVTSLPSANAYIFGNATTTNNQMTFTLSTTGYVSFSSQGTYTAQTAAGVISINNWHHVAAVRNGTTVTVYVDGVAGSTTATIAAGTAIDTAAAQLILGNNWNNGVNTNKYTGYLDEVRVSKGVARYTAAFNTALPSAAFGGATTSLTDSAYANTVLLLHGDGNNGILAGIRALNYDQFPAKVDSSVLNANMTPYQYTTAGVSSASTAGPTFSSTVTPKIGPTSLYFDGSVRQYLQTPTSANYAFGSKDFTIEFWLNPTAYAISYIFGCGASANMLINMSSTGGIGAYSTISGTTVFQRSSTSGTTAPLNQWTHIALVRYGTIVTLYVGGVAQSNASDSNILTSSTSVDSAASGYYLTIGGSPLNYYATGLTGYMDEIRVTIGTARYTAGFTPATAAFPSVPTGTVATDFYSDAVGNLTTGAASTGVTYASWASSNNIAYAPVTVWYDQSTLANNATAVAGTWPVYDSANYLVDFTTSLTGLYGGNATVMSSPPGTNGPGNGNFMTLPDGTMSIGTGLTVTARHGTISSNYPSGVFGSSTIVSGGQLSSIAALIASPTSTYWMNLWQNPNAYSTALVSVGNTISFVYSPGSVTPYVNGVANASSGHYISLTPSYNCIGNLPGGSGIGNGWWFNGQICFISMFNSGLSATDRTIVEAQGSFADPYYYATALLMHGDSYTGITDSSLYSASITPNTTALSTAGTYPNANSMFSSAMYFNNTYVQTPTTALYTFGNQNFTIEFWMYIVTKPTSSVGIIGNNIINTSSAAWGIYTDGTNMWTQFHGNSLNFGAVPYVSTFTGNWNHFAFVRNGTTATFYVNGVAQASSAWGTTSIDSGSGSNTITIGNWPPTLANGINAYMDDVRVTIGVARYTTNFSTPMYPYPGMQNLPVIINAYLETTSTPSTTWTNGLMSNSSATCTGWTFTTGATILNSSMNTSMWGTVQAQNGTNQILLQSTSSQNPVATGTISYLSVGTTYIVGMYVLSRPTNGGNTLKVTVNTTPTASTIYTSAAITNSSTWTYITCSTFTATATSHTIALAGALGSPSDVSVYVDSLSLATYVPPTVTYATFGLLNYWDFNNSTSYSGSGTTLTDLAGTSTLTLTNGTGFNSSPKSESFGGNTSAAYTLTNAIVIASTGMTIEMLFTYLGGGNEWFFSTGSTIGWGSAGGGINCLASGSQIQMYGGTTSGSSFLLQPFVSGWMHYVIIIGTGGGVVTYCNTVGGSANGTTSNSTLAANSTVTFGYLNNMASSGLVGKMAMMRVYNKPLTAGDVTMNYNSIKSLSGNPYSLP